MHDTADRALVEISLALAMAFFALMVLALVGMGIPAAGAPPSQPEAETMALRESRETPPEAQAPESAPESAAADLLVVHWRGRWYDEGLAAVSPSTLEPGARRVVVAVAPDVTVADAQAMQRALAPLEPTLTTLSPQWIERLEAMP